MTLSEEGLEVIPISSFIAEEKHQDKIILYSYTNLLNLYF